MSWPSAATSAPPRSPGLPAFGGEGQCVGREPEVVTCYLDPGNTNSSARLIDLLQAILAEFEQRGLALCTRLDAAYGSLNTVTLLTRAGVGLVLKWSIFKVSKHVFAMANLRTRRFTRIAGFLRFVMITHDLLVWTKAALFARSKLAVARTQGNRHVRGAIPRFGSNNRGGLPSPTRNLLERSLG